MMVDLLWHVRTQAPHYENEVNKSEYYSCMACATWYKLLHTDTYAKGSGRQKDGGGPDLYNVYYKGVII